jgi:fructose-1-phosphate kinase PfkB-like protein
MVIMAGAPPRWESPPEGSLTTYNFYAEVIGSLHQGCLVSIDTSGQYLRRCLTSQKTPHFVLMNRDEFGELKKAWNELEENQFSGFLMVHDENGCWIWDGGLPNKRELFLKAEYIPSVPVLMVYSTIGAGDAMHAGFLKEWFCSEGTREKKLHRAVIYSQTVAAVSVSNEKATHGIDANAVKDKFQQVWDTR